MKTEGCLSENDYNHRIYCTTTRDFRRFSKTRLWYNPDFNAIDAAIVRDAQTGDYIMAVKNENLNPAEKNIRIARTRSIKKGFPNEVSAPINSRSDKNGKPYWCEGPAPLYVGNDLVVYYDMYGAHQSRPGADLGGLHRPHPHAGRHESRYGHQRTAQHRRPTSREVAPDGTFRDTKFGNSAEYAYFCREKLIDNPMNRIPLCSIAATSTPCLGA